MNPRDDYWTPRPGSWEEAVDPYDVQFSRGLPRKKKKVHERDVPIEVLTDPRRNYHLPAAL